MEITGKIVQILDAQEGKSGEKTWKRQDIIIDQDGPFGRKLCLSNWNDKVDLSSLQTGDSVKVSVNLESREYNGRWYTDVKIWKIEKSRDTTISQPITEYSTEDPNLDWLTQDSDPMDDMPF